MHLVNDLAQIVNITNIVTYLKTVISWTRPMARLVAMIPDQAAILH